MHTRLVIRKKEHSSKYNLLSATTYIVYIPVQLAELINWFQESVPFWHDNNFISKVVYLGAHLHAKFQEHIKRSGQGSSTEK